MAYNLRLDNANIWGGAKAGCLSWERAGTLGKKLCEDLTNAPESCATPSGQSYYICMIY